LTSDVLSAFINITHFLNSCPAGGPLLKQMFEQILFAPQLWIRATADVSPNQLVYKSYFLDTTPFV
jgi:hypothetical protein